MRIQLTLYLWEYWSPNSDTWNSHGLCCNSNNLNQSPSLSFPSSRDLGPFLGAEKRISCARTGGTVPTLQQSGVNSLLYPALVQSSDESCITWCLQPGYEEHTEQIPWYEGPTTRGKKSLFLSQYKLKFPLNFCYGNVPDAGSHTHTTWARPEISSWLQWPDRHPPCPLLTTVPVRPSFLTSSTPGFLEQCLRHPNP